MGEIGEFFKGLFATGLWPARWNCGQWSDFHGWLYIISDLMIWFSYFAIPVIIVGYTYKKKFELKYTKTYFLFASFILLCGSTHLLDASMFWVPMYRFSALILFLTGVVSLFTVYHLIRILPDAFMQKTSLVLEKEISKRVETEDKLFAANKALEAFAYMASHDLQEPLRKIRMFTGRLYEANETNFDEDSKKWAEKTMVAADRMQRIIQGFLSLSSLNEKVEMTAVDLNSIIEGAKTDLEVKIHEKGAVVEYDKLPSVYGNHEYLALLFLNLISNAIKFSDKQPNIRIEAEEHHGRVTVHVTDNGIGMRQSDIPEIFKTFYRIHNKDAYEGSGIGLSICKRIVDIHKGDITVKSELGRGTTFSVVLPSEPEMLPKGA